MIYTKHVGIYVNDMEREKQLYQNVFQMDVICDAYRDQNEMLCELFQEGKGEALITKLITPLGKETGMGEMLELLHVTGQGNKKEKAGVIYEPGTAHICFGVDDMSQTVERVKSNGGIQKTKIYCLGQKLCTFCMDPEGNWIELIC